MGTQLRIHGASLLRNHWHALLIVPVVVIAMTWPTFPRIFDSQDYWFHTGHGDFWIELWNAWHIERVLAGETELYYSKSMFHPNGVSLVFQLSSYPHLALLMLLRKLMSVDSAYNLLFLLILCFNAYGAYVLILHLIHDKWIALFGAIVVCLSVPFLGNSTIPILILIGTIPLTIYFFLRQVTDNHWMFAALAGACAGLTAFVSVYIFFINLMTIGILAMFRAVLHWNRPAFWRGLLLLLAVCATTSSLRIFPMLIDASNLKEGLETHLGQVGSNDVLECCVMTDNPFTGHLFRRALALPPDADHDSSRLGNGPAYLGYINMFLIVYALCHKPLRRSFAPWMAVLVVFSILRLGHFLTIYGQEYRHILLPEHFLTEWFPALFGSFYIQAYYQLGVVVPLAVLASYGLARLIKSKPAPVRATFVLLSVLILVIEFYDPLPELIVEREKTAYSDWLSTETDSSIKLINLPQSNRRALYFMGLQTFNHYPLAFGFSSRNPQSARTYIRSNGLLTTWDDNDSVHCLPYKERTYISALDQLLADGFTHVVVHNWLEGDEFIIHSFWNVPAAYDDGFVSIYRLADLRMSCETERIELPHYKHFAESPTAVPGRRSSILSFHQTKSIDADLFAYLDSLFSDWQSLLHLFLDDSELTMQSAGKHFPDMESFARDNHLIYLLYNKRDADAAALHVHPSLDRFNLCRRDEREDGSVIAHYLSQEFSCELITSGQPLQVDYENGIRLNNALLNHSLDRLHLQFMWSSLPNEPHSISLQVFDLEGAKVLSQDSTIGHISLAHYDINLSHLPPGDYHVKLIVYSYESKRSVSGIVSGTGERFERELLLSALTRY